MLPSQDAVTMKRGQEEVQQKNITALLDRKKQLQGMIVQTDIDLEHVGYTPPMEAAGPEKKTYLEWRDECLAEGIILTTKCKLDEYEAHEKRAKDLERKNNILRSKLWAKQKRDAQPRKRKAVKKK